MTGTSQLFELTILLPSKFNLCFINEAVNHKSKNNTPNNS